ncbi:hypothetical protein NPIL_3861, partial [Nephila pilipes]
STLGTGVAVSDLKGNETSMKTDEKSIESGDNCRLSCAQKEPSRIENWLQSVAFSKEQSFDMFDDMQGLLDIPSNLSSWEGKM